MLEYHWGKLGSCLGFCFGKTDRILKREETRRDKIFASNKEHMSMTDILCLKLCSIMCNSGLLQFWRISPINLGVKIVWLVICSQGGTQGELQGMKYGIILAQLTHQRKVIFQHYQDLAAGHTVFWYWFYWFEAVCLWLTGQILFLVPNKMDFVNLLRTLISVLQHWLFKLSWVFFFLSMNNRKQF